MLCTHDHSGNTPILANAALLLQTHELKAKISDAAFSEPFSAQRLFQCMEQLPRLRYLLSQDARVLEGYSLADHHLMVLSQYERYFRHVALPPPVTHGAFSICLNLHDSGKSIPEHKCDQHHYTLDVMESLRPYLPIQDREWAALTTIVGSDALGKFIKPIMVQYPASEVRKSWIARAIERPLTLKEILEYRTLTTIDSSKARGTLAETVDSIVQLARHAAMTPSNFYRLNMLYFQCDTCAYGNDASSPLGRRGMPGLEYMYEINPRYRTHGRDRLYVVDPATGYLKFVPAVDALFKLIERALPRA